MSDQSQGPGWWLASDGKWYPPETSPAPAPAAVLPTPRPSRTLLVISIAVAALAVAAATALVLRGSDHKPVATPVSSETTDSSSTSSTRSSSQSKPPSAVLQLSDFPSGWQAEPRGPTDSTVDNDALQAFAVCLGIDPSLVSGDDTSKSKSRSDKFTDGSTLEVTADAEFESSASDAQAALAAMKKPGTPACLQQLFSAALTTAQQDSASTDSGLSDLTLGTVTVQPLDTSPLHGQTAGFQVSVPITSAGVSLPVDVDFVFVAEGRTTLTLTFQSVSEAFPLGLEQILANAAIDRASTF